MAKRKTLTTRERQQQEWESMRLRGLRDAALSDWKGAERHGFKGDVLDALHQRYLDASEACSKHAARLALAQ